MGNSGAVWARPGTWKYVIGTWRSMGGLAENPVPARYTVFMSIGFDFPTDVR